MGRGVTSAVGPQRLRIDAHALRVVGHLEIHGKSLLFFIKQPKDESSFMKNQTTIARVKNRLERHSLWEHIKGLWFSRKLSTHGIIVVTGSGSFPKVINRGGEIYAGNCQFYEGVRLEIGKGASLTSATDHI